MNSRRLGVKSFLFGILALFIFSGVSIAGASWEDNIFSSTAEGTLARLINIEHYRICGKDLLRAYQLNRLSRWRAQDMAVRDYLSHTILGTDKTVFDYFDQYRIKDSISAGEIIAWNNYPSDISVGRAYYDFYNSEGHRLIIQDCSYNTFGVGTYKKSNGQIYYAVVFSQQPVRYVKVSILNIYARPGSQYVVLNTLNYRARMLVFSYTQDRYKNLWYHVHTPKGWGWVQANKTRVNI